MLKKKNKGIGVLIAVLLTVTLGGTLFFVARQRSALNFDIKMEARPNNVYDRTLVVTADADYDPYTFLNANGEICGHDVELLYLLADRMGYNTEIRLLPWGEALAAVEAGDADMVLTVAWSPETYPGFDLSIPLVNDPFVAFGKEPFEQIGELYDRRLAVLEGTGCIADFIKPYRLDDNTRRYPSNTAAFAAVTQGERDYAIARYSVGRRAMARLGTGEIQAVGPTLLNNSVCIGVKRGNAALLSALDDAIVAFSANGTLAALSDKWLGRYVQTLTPAEFVAQNAQRLVFFAGFLLLLFLVGFILVNHAVAAQREGMLKRLAERDPLTGLYNRVTCEGMIRETLNGSVPAENVHALLVIDMDNFKQVNDTFGHMEGDAALIRLAGDLSRIFRKGDVVGRLGGDEFFVFMPQCMNVEVAVQKAQRVCAVSGNTLARGGAALALSASVGIAMYPAQGTDFLALYRRADEALYKAKRGGKKGCAFYGENGELTYRAC